MNELKTTFVIDEGNSPQKVRSFKTNLNDLNSQINELGKDSKFGQKITADFDKLQTKAKETQKSFQTIQTTRLDAGNANHLTREIVRASERSRQLAVDIGSIKKELANPNRSSSIKFLTEELRAAEREADQLGRKLSTLPSSSASIGGTRGKTGGRGGGGGRGRITGEQAALLEILDDFAPAGTNKPFNSVVRGALVAGDIKEAAAGLKVAGKEMLALVGISGTALATFGAIAAVGYGIVKITENIRAEAERRLKVENDISAAVNRQILSQKEALANFKEQQIQAQKAREFGRYLNDSSIEELARRRGLLEKLQSLTPRQIHDKPNPVFENQSQGIDAINAQIDALGQRNRKTADDSFNQRWDSWKKSQEDAIKAQEKFNEEIEKGKNKVKELEKQYLSTFDNLLQKTNQNNPFVSVFSEADKALQTLRENLKGLPADLQTSAIAMQQKLNANTLFATRLDNKLDTFDLRERARNFRNPQESEEQKRQFKDIVQRSILEKGSYGDFIVKNSKRRADGNFEITQEQERSIYEVALFGNLPLIGNPANSTFNDLNANSLQTALANDRVRSGGSENLSINDRLKKQLDIINSGVSTETERDIADRKLIGLTNGLNPSEINSNLREQIAAANEREAARRDGYERESLSIEKEKLAVQQQIAENGKRLLAIAEKEGLQGLNKAVEILITNKSGGAADVKETGKSADGGDTRSYYEQSENR